MTTLIAEPTEESILSEITVALDRDNVCIPNRGCIMLLQQGWADSSSLYYGLSPNQPQRLLLRNTFKMILPLSQRNIDFIMIRTKDKNYHQILVDGKTYSELHLRYGASRSFNEVITEILQHHEAAISIIGDCESSKSKFKEAIQKE